MTDRERLADTQNALTYSQEEMLRGAIYLIRAALTIEGVNAGQQLRLRSLEIALDATEDALFTFHGCVAPEVNRAG